MRACVRRNGLAAVSMFTPRTLARRPQGIRARPRWEPRRSVLPSRPGQLEDPRSGREAVSDAPTRRAWAMNEIPDGTVNLYGHVQNNERLREGPYVNICVEHTSTGPSLSTPCDGPPSHGSTIRGRGRRRQQRKRKSIAWRRSRPQGAEEVDRTNPGTGTAENASFPSTGWPGPAWYGVRPEKTATLLMTKHGTFRFSRFQETS